MLKFDWNSVFTLINLIVFYLLMKKFLFGRIKKVLDARRDMIDGQFKKAEETEALADEKLADYESRIANYEEEGKKIISDAKATAKTEYDKIIEKAQSDAKELRADTEKQLEDEREASRKATKEEFAVLVMETAEKVVGANVTAESDSAIFDEFLKESSDE